MKHIVVIDDDVDVREVTIFALENEGYKVVSFDNGKKALDYLLGLNQADLPGLIIVDYMMPQMDGAAFVNEVKNINADTLGHLSIAITSAMDKVESKVKSQDVIYLHKPMDLEELLDVVKVSCGGQSLP
jgi:CheY-like chemotaxis protein